MHARRALLYMPGDDRHKIEKAFTLDVDCICMDMEDGVALNRKSEARRTIAAALCEVKPCRSEKLARINAIGSGLELEDIEAILPCRPDGIVVPKVESLEQVQWASGRIEAAELAHGWPVNSIRLIVDVESAKGMLALKEIASHPRLDALIFGAEDYAVSIGAVRTPEAWEVFTARSLVVMHAKAFGLQAIDMVTVDFRDLERLRGEAVFGAQLGYTGKQIIHPAQVEPVQQAFTPDDESIEKARRLVEAFEAHQKEGRGAFALDGKMIDMPLVKAAQGVLERACAAGKGHIQGTTEVHTPGGDAG
jgi:citrate lyase beta subunit